MKMITVIFCALLVLVAWGSGWSAEAAHLHSGQERKEVVWTCSMHPQIRLNAPGQCPICKMDLIPGKDSAADMKADPAAPVLQLSPAAEKLAEVEVSKVERKLVAQEVKLVGRVEPDESRIARISMRFSGWIEQLYVNYTGIAVRKGDHIAEVFSPDLIIMQREYLDALRESGGNSGNGTVKSVVNKMRIWGFSPEQIDEIGKKGKISERLTVLAPIDGIVIEKGVVKGQYFNKEEKLFTIADLSHLWLVLDAYETDIQFLRYGQSLNFQVDAWPGENFRGRISYINPMMDRQTRTIPVRVDLDNSNGKLKPGRYARAEVYVSLDDKGMVINNELAGKWISPMHPRIVKDAPGTCDVCGMALVPAESLGYVGASAAASGAPLVNPASAPLITGRRAIVYVRTGPGRYEGRQIVPGAKVGNYYMVKSGIKEGEEVVTSGNMKIDSAVQIAGLKSMTSPENFDPENPAVKAEADSGFNQKMIRVFECYFALHQPLVKSDAALTAAALTAFRGAVVEFSSANEPWHHVRGEILALLPESAAKELEIQRQQYSAVTGMLYQLAQDYELKKHGLKFYRFYCSMAFDNKGGYWMQDKPGLENPYFGRVMLNCGEEK